MSDYLKGMISWSPNAEIHYIDPDTKEPICGMKSKSNQYWEAPYRDVTCSKCLRKKLKGKYEE